MPGYFTVQDATGLDLYGKLRRLSDDLYWNEADKTLETPYVKADHGFVINESAIAGIYEVTLSAGSDALDGAFQFVVLNDADDTPRPGGVMHVRFEKGEEVATLGTTSIAAVVDGVKLKKVEDYEAMDGVDIDGTSAGEDAVARSSALDFDTSELVVKKASGAEWYRKPVTLAEETVPPVIGVGGVEP